ncbi:MAG: glycosyl transferase [Lachnospiraceae bacterium]|nr:glycosyl transferase [Lachnospiraceae bacterium]MBQ8947864.1 glycosyl transferase [Lachnospiraceae bacterium]
MKNTIIKIKHMGKMILDEDYRFRTLYDQGKYDHMSDGRFIRRQWKYELGKEQSLNLEDPQSFNEKIQWLKLNDRDPVYHILADKVEVKKWVAERLGEEYVIPTIGIWDNADEVDFEALPERFVIKCSHNSGLGNCVCTDKTKLDYSLVRNELNRYLEQDYYLLYREWVYKDIVPRVIAEKYMGPGGTESLVDYKVHCFSGKPRFIQVIGGRDYKTHNAWQVVYDTDWNEQTWTFGTFHKTDEVISQPSCLAELLEAAESLSDGLRYVRVDFYIINNRIFFGEMTFYPHAGMYRHNRYFTPEINRFLGDLIIL